MQVSTPSSSSTISMRATSRCTAVCTKANTHLVRAPPVLALHHPFTCVTHLLGTAILSSDDPCILQVQIWLAKEQHMFCAHTVTKLQDMLV